MAFPAHRAKRLFPLEEVEQIRETARAEGERSALASVAAQQANALSQIAAACNQALPRLAEVAHEHRQGSAALAIACARAIADAALTKFPEAPVQAALETLAREIDAQPRLVVSAEPALAEALKGASDSLREMFFSNMSERAAKIMREDMETMGPVRLRDVDQAQMAIVQVAKDLANKGEIMLAGSGTDDELIY